MSHDHYFRDVTGLQRIDVYRLLDLFDVTCPVAQHVVKKAIAAGQRGHKSIRRDWQDIADSARRKLEMIGEDNGWTRGAIKAATTDFDRLQKLAREAEDPGSSLNQRASAWDGIVSLLNELSPGWSDRNGTSLFGDAVHAIRNMAGQSSASGLKLISGDWPDETRRQDAAAEDEAWKAIEARMDAIGQNGNDGEHYDRCQDCASCECRP